MDENQEKAIAVYANRRQLEDSSKYKNLKSYRILPITLLLRWTKNYNKAETEANKIYELLDCSSLLMIIIAQLSVYTMAQLIWEQMKTTFISFQ